jgi:hypothetical protein
MLRLDGRLRWKSSGGSHLRDLRLVPSPVQLVIVVRINLRSGGAIRAISGTLEREGRGECCGYFEVSMW